MQGAVEHRLNFFEDTQRIETFGPAAVERENSTDSIRLVRAG
jgi:hypothetical protein